MRSLTEFDILIIGSGAAGCVLADRLSTDTTCRVGLVEAGPNVTDASNNIDIPSHWPLLLGTQSDWGFCTTPQGNLNHRVISWPRGRMVGGSAAMNAMVYVRGSSTDFEGWREYGGPDWSYNQFVELFKRVEDPLLGGLEIDYQRTPHPFTVTFLEASRILGYPNVEDVDIEAQIGIGLYRVTRKRGHRSSVLNTHLCRALSRVNFTLLPDTQALRLEISSGVVRGVHVSSPTGIRFISATTETILSAGTIGSPVLLLHSGIGPADELSALGITPRVNLRGVGKNLHDHVQTSLSLRAAQPIPVAQESNIGEGGGFINAHCSNRTPAIQLVFAPTLGLSDKDSLGRGFSLGPAVTQPISRGTVRICSSDPVVPPLIDPAYLSAGQDMDLLVEGLQVCLEILSSAHFAKLTSGSALKPMTRAEAQHYCRVHAHTQFHPVGSCRIGHDEEAVLDAGMHVYGVAGLRVVDASVMPTITSANTCAPVMAIAEMAALQVRNAAASSLAVQRQP